LNRMRVLVRFQWEYLDRLNPLLDDGVVRQVEVQYDSYINITKAPSY
jgi:hypothetical protein